MKVSATMETVKRTDGKMDMRSQTLRRNSDYPFSAQNCVLKNKNLKSTIVTSGLVTTKNTLLLSGTLKRSNLTNTILDSLAQNSAEKRKSVDNSSLILHNKQLKTVQTSQKYAQYTSPPNPLLLSFEVKDFFPLNQAEIADAPATQSLKRFLSAEQDENRIAERKNLHKKFDHDNSLTSKNNDLFEPVQYDFMEPDDYLVTPASFSWHTENKLSTVKNIRAEQMRLKVSLVNSVSTALIRGPNMKDALDPVRLELVELCATVSQFDPEFILKIALYTRQELNIRTLCNLLLAYSAYNVGCRSYLTRYFNKCVVLPSDWMDVAEQYQLFDDKSIKRGSLPSVLRKALIKKFSDFDAYQLAKYNKDKPVKKKRVLYGESDSEDEETEEELVRRTFTLKQLIRLLHIKDPADYVMALIGKKYPETAEQFRSCRLDGVWDENRKGKRMKLPVPFTWETQLSLLGNKRQTWEKLIDSKKLPYMATLRNLRNILLAGVSPSHHNNVIKLLTDENAVKKSRQFPHRFLYAEEVLAQLEETMYTQGDVGKVLAKKGEFPARRGCGKARPTCQEAAAIERKKLQIAAKTRTMRFLYDRPDDVFSKYKKALRTAVKIATFHNVPPISGRTVLLLDAGSAMTQVCKTAKGLGKAHTASDIAKLLANLCSSACEVFTLNEFDSLLSDGDKSLKYIDETLFTPLVRDRQKVNNVIVLTHDKEVDFISHFVCKYRLAANPDVLYVTISLAAPKNGVTSSKSEQNDVILSGFTDNMFKFISERGNGGQLGYIDKIDVKYDLPPLKHSGNIKAKNVVANIPVSVERCSSSMWKTVKVFISSTFVDMHGERDLLVRYVFPELRRRARHLFIDVHEVDLRWGITKEESASSKWLEICLTEVSKCQLFIGIIGGRYGTVPTSYDIPNANPALDWLNDYPKGSSITELEFHMGALSKTKAAKDKAFFFIRDSTFQKDIPAAEISNFVETNGQSRDKLDKLKRKMVSSNIPTFNGYPCEWGGYFSGKPVTKGLEEFGSSVLNNLWTALQTIARGEEKSDKEQDSQKHNLHAEYASKLHNEFVGQKRLVLSCMECVRADSHKVVAVEGKQGSGKTILMGHLTQLILQQSDYPVIPCFVGANTAFGYSDRILEYISNEIRRVSNLPQEPDEDNRNIISEFMSLIGEAALKVSKIVIVLDGLDLLQSCQQTKSLEWLNLEFPSGILIVCSCIGGGLIYRNLVRQPATKTIHVGPVSLPDRLQIIRMKLQSHGKTLDESCFNNQLQLLTSKHDSNLPIYLSMACEELRTFGAFEKLTDKIKSMSNTVEGLLGESIIRLEKEFGLQIVSGILGFLTISENGISEEDLYVLLKIYGALWKRNNFSIGDVQSTMLYEEENIPRATFSLLIRALQFLLHLVDPSGDGTLKLAHANMATIVRSKYKKSVLSANGERLLHLILAGYFWYLLDPQLSYTKFDCIPRALASLPHHLQASGLFIELQKLLCNLYFILAKLLAGMSDQLLFDYSSFLTLAPLSTSKSDLKVLNLEKVRQFQRFVGRNLNILRPHPLLTIQQAYNEPENTHVAIEANEIARGNSRNGVPVPIRWENKPDIQDDCRLTIKLSKPSLCSALSPDEKIVAVGDEIIVNLYDFETGKKIYSLTGHSEEITCILFLNQTKLCSGSRDGTIALWNIETGSRISLTKAHQRKVTSLCCNNSTLSFVSVSLDATIKIWKSSNGEFVSKIVHLPKKWCSISCVSFHPTKQLIVTGSWDSNLRIWNMEKLKISAVLHGHSASVRSVGISPNGRIICSTAFDSTLKLWSLSLGFMIANISSLDPFSDVSFSPCGNHLIAGNNDKTVKIYPARMGKVVGKMASTKNVKLLCLTAYNADTVVCGYQDGYIQLLKISTAEEKHTARCGSAPVTCIVSYEKWGMKIIAAGMQDGRLVVLDLDLEIKYVLLGHTSAITSIATDNSFLLSGNDYGVVITHMIPYKLDKGVKQVNVEAECTFQAHDGMISSISINQDCSEFATTSTDHVLKTWKIHETLKENNPAGEMVPTFTFDVACHAGKIRASCWTENFRSGESLVVTTGDDLTMVAWNTVTGEMDWTVSDFNAPVTYLLAHNHVIVGCSLDGNVCVWSSCGDKLTSVKGACESVFCGFFDEGMCAHDTDDEIDKRQTPTEILSKLAEFMKYFYIVRTDNSGRIELIQPCMDKARDTLVGHSDGVLSLCCGLDGRLVTTSLDGTVKLWTPKCFSIDAVTENDNRFRHHAEVSCLYYCNVNHIVLTGDRNGYILIWKNVSNKWQAITRTCAHRKAVTGLATIQNGSLISSISNDCRLKVWQLISLDKSSSLLCSAKGADVTSTEYKLRFEVKVDLSNPITCFEFSHKTNKFFVGVTSGELYAVTVIKQDQEKMRLSSEPVICNYKDKDGNLKEREKTDIVPHAVHMKLIDERPSQHILLTNSFGEMKAWRISEGTNEIWDLKLRLDDVKLPEFSDEIVAFKRPSVWCPTSLALEIRDREYRSEFSADVALGLHDGRVMFFELDFEPDVSRNRDAQYYRTSTVAIGKIHKSVTGMNFASPNFDTGSIMCIGDNDGSVKVWEFKSTAEYKQIAQFFCTTPVNCVSAIRQPKSDILLVICGDLVGNMYFLNARLISE